MLYNIYIIKIIRVFLKEKRMKKLYLRILALVLAALAVATVFAGCGNGQGGEETTDNNESSESETVDEVFPDVERKNYNKELYLSIMNDVNPDAFYWVAEAGNNNLSDAIYNRQENVRSYLGVDIVASITPNEDRYIVPFQTAVKNKDGSVDVLLSHVYYGIDGFIVGNYLTDFNDIPEIDLEADYWKLDFMEGIAANNHLYLGFSDFNILYTHVITFNKDLLDRYADAMHSDVYTMVTDYKWTLDAMNSLASLVYVDTTADGKTEDDTFGFACQLSTGYAGFLQASNIQLVEQDAKGSYVVSVYNEKNKDKMATLVNKLYDFVRAEYVYLPNEKTATSISSGRALMSISGTYWLSGLLDYDLDFGVLPFPMYDENQKDVGYRSLQWGGYICVPTYLTDAKMVGETLEMLSYYSEDVNIAFYEKMLGKQVADAPLDRKMLDIVWDGVCSDLGQTYYSVIRNNTTKYMYIVNMLTQEGTTFNLASYMATVESSANKNLKKFFAQVGD